jgi:phosphoserine phosphatase RsbU/P
MKKLSDCRVLLVDDAKANLDILVEGLKSDHKLSLALNGEMALQAAARRPPDLVLLDIVMPGMDGYEVCRRLRQMPETAEVPIMFLSSLEEVQNKTRGFEAGANDYLTKPFEMLEVKARVRALLKAKAYSDAVKEQIASELRVAREIQMGMLPHDFGAFEGAYPSECRCGARTCPRGWRRFLRALRCRARATGGISWGRFWQRPARRHVHGPSS